MLSSRKLGFSIVGSAAVAAAAFAAPVMEGGVKFTATMTGAQELPGPGDPNGTGTAILRVNPGQQRICYEIDVANIDGTINLAHIHVINPATGFGPPVVDLIAPVNGSSSGCAEFPNVTRAEALAIIRNPENYYVNVHSLPDFGAGAVRGGLTKGI